MKSHLKIVTWSSQLAALLAFLLFSLSVFAEKMDIETHSLVISKLERVLPRLEESDSSKLPTLIRLGDLYAERARLSAMLENESNCVECAKSFKDRVRALHFYSQAFPKTALEQRGRLAFQMAHLYEITGKSLKSQEIYKNLLTESAHHYSPDFIAKVQVNLGDLYYRQGHFQEAQNHFTKALRIPQLEKKGYALYRLAWVQLNLGNLEGATQSLITILKDQKYLSDQSFHDDVARDLATFYARGSVSASELQLLAELTPEASRKPNFMYLARECERLGKKIAALMVWGLVSKMDPDAFEQLEASVHSAQLRYELNQRELALSEMKSAIEIWRKKGCEKSAECEILQARLKKIVLDWYKSEKQKPTPQLVNAFASYLGFFETDVDMHYFAALAAREQKSYRNAAQFYRKTSLLALQAMIAKPAPGPSDLKRYKNIFQDSTLAEIEMAETLKDPGLRESAYVHFLKVNSSSPKALEVRYQLAHVHYEMAQYKTAASEFRDVARAENKSAAHQLLRKQAADLALDAQAQLKANETIEAWALEFAGLFPEARSEYSAIARKSVMHQIAPLLESKNVESSNRSEISQALAKLEKMNLFGANMPERKQILKTRVQLAKRSVNFSGAQNAVTDILLLPGLSVKEREEALAEKVWLAEMQLDFVTAYKISLKMRMDRLSPQKKALRLAMLSELAGLNPTRHYQEYLKLAGRKVTTESNLVRSKLVKLSSQPMKTLKNFSWELSRQPSVYAPLVLDVFVQTRNFDFAEKSLKLRGVKETAAGQLLARNIFIRDFNLFAKKAKSSTLSSASDFLLKKSLSQWISHIRQADQWVERAIRSQDWTLQLLTLDLAAQENQRLYQALISLPVPRSLKGKQRDQYKSLLEQQASAYSQAAFKIKSKVEEFWQNSSALEALAGDYKLSRGSTKIILADEIRQLARIAPRSTSSFLLRALKTNGPSEREIQMARESLAKNPFDRQSMERLRSLENEAGREIMVAYLSERAQTLNGVRQ